MYVGAVTWAGCVTVVVASFLPPKSEPKPPVRACKKRQVRVYATKLILNDYDLGSHVLYGR